MNEFDLIKAKDQLASEVAKSNRFMSFLKSYEQDMNFTPTTELEECLKDCLTQIFEEAHKQFDRR
jgi:hypothetical protein